MRWGRERESPSPIWLRWWSGGDHWIESSHSARWSDLWVSFFPSPTTSRRVYKTRSTWSTCFNSLYDPSDLKTSIMLVHSITLYFWVCMHKCAIWIICFHPPPDRQPRLSYQHHRRRSSAGGQCPAGKDYLQTETKTAPTSSVCNQTGPRVSTATNASVGGSKFWAFRSFRFHHSQQAWPALLAPGLAANGTLQQLWPVWWCRRHQFWR